MHHQVADPARRGVHQHRFPLAEPGAVDQQLPGRDALDQEGDGVAEFDRLPESEGESTIGNGVLGIPSLDKGDHPGTDEVRLDPLTDRSDHPGHLGAHGAWQVPAALSGHVDALAGHHVGVVDSADADLDQDRARWWLGRLDVLDHEHVRAAGVVDAHCLHDRSISRVLARWSSAEGRNPTWTK